MLGVRLDPDTSIVSEGAAISSTVEMQPPRYTIFDANVIISARCDLQPISIDMRRGRQRLHGWPVDAGKQIGP
jgi:hypothetical protein